MVDGQVAAHTPNSYHKYYHPTMPLNFFVTSSPTLCTCLSAITSMTSVISPTTSTFTIVITATNTNTHSTPQLCLWLPWRCSMFNVKIKKSLVFINLRSDVGRLPAKVPVQLLVPPPPEQHQSSPTKLYMQCILRTLCTNVSTATSSDPSFYSPTMSLTSLVSSLVTSSFTLCISPSTIWWL